MCPRGIADRVNLGLIPSSEQGWPVACAALNPLTGGILHVHDNVTTAPQQAVDCSRLQVNNLTPNNAMEHAVAQIQQGQKMGERSTKCSNEYESVEALQSISACNMEKKTLQMDNNMQRDLSQEVKGQQGDQEVKGQHGDLHKARKQCDGFMSRTDAIETTFTENAATLLRTHNALVSDARKQWCDWARNVAGQIKSILEKMHVGKEWKVDVVHVEHVKSYAPHVDHLVADVECRPAMKVTGEK